MRMTQTHPTFFITSESFALAVSCIFIFFRQNDNKPAQRQPLERHESNHIQNTAKILQNLSKSRFMEDSSNHKSPSYKNKDRRASSVSLNDNCYCEKSGSKRSHRSHSFHGGRSTEQLEKDKMAASLNCRDSEKNIKVWSR